MTIKLCAVLFGGNEVDEDGVHGGLLGCIKIESAHYSVLDKVVLLHEQYMLYKCQKPDQEQYDQIFVFLLVHDLHDVVQVFVDQWVLGFCLSSSKSRSFSVSYVC